MLEVKVPEVAESITEVTLGEWYKEDGEYIEQDEVLCVIETDKASMEIVAEQAGTVKCLAEEGDTVPVKAVVASIDTSAKAPEKPKQEAAAKSSKETATENPAKQQSVSDLTSPPKSTTSAEKTPTSEPLASPELASAGTVKVSPAAGVALKEAGMTPEEFSRKTGIHGRISLQDVRAQMHKDPTPPPRPSKNLKAEEERVPFSTLRKKLAERLVAVKNQTAMLTTFNEVNLSAIQSIRDRHQEAFQEKHGIKLGYMSFFAKAVSRALLEYPVINASIDGDEIVFFRNHHLGIAVSSDRGLVVPVVRSVEDMSLGDIEHEISRLAQRARSSQLSLEEMEGGTFTITNGGVFGSMMSTPILNPPQSAILGMHAIEDRPIAENGEVVIRPMMYIALSYDHRLIDGRDSVGFLKKVKMNLEDPTRLLVDL